MSRSPPSALTTAVDQPHVTHLCLLQVDLDSGALYLTSAPHSVDWAGNTYQAAAGIGTIEAVTEVDGIAKGLSFTLSLVNEAAIASGLAEHVQGRRVTLRWGVITPADGLVVDPNVWRGQFDVQTIEDGPQPVLRVMAEHAMIAWDQAPGLLFSHADQLRLHPGDQFFSHAAAMAEAKLVWPGKEFFQQ